MTTYLLALAFVLNLAASVVAVFVTMRAMTEVKRANTDKQADREYLLWLQDHIARGVDLLARGCASSQDQAGASNESGDDGNHNRDARRLH